LIFSLKLCSSAELPTVECEKLDDYDCQPESKVCVLTESTTIDAPGYTVLSPVNKAVKRITIAYNKKIEYIPEHLYKVFPDLEHVDGAASSVKQLSKATFHNLHKLEKIHLDGNKIERIEADTFESLTTLKKIFLSLIIFDGF
jgi:hypothetical protein